MAEWSRAPANPPREVARVRISAIRNKFVFCPFLGAMCMRHCKLGNSVSSSKYKLTWNEVCCEVDNELESKGSVFNLVISSLAIFLLDVTATAVGDSKGSSLLSNW